MVHKSLPAKRARRLHQRAPVTKYLAKEGDAHELICPHCKDLVNTHARVRTYHEHGSGIDVPGVLLIICERCDQAAGIPAQSTPRIREVRVPLKEVQLEARIPTHLEDVIYLLAR